jgi:phage shock protein PspC (stress-responsive transcriptional regulator)
MSKLYRSRRDKKVTGLCGGLAELMNVDATLLRLLVVITTFFSGGTVIFIYIIASLVIPKEPGFDPPYGGGYGDPYATGHGHGYGGSWSGGKARHCGHGHGVHGGSGFGPGAGGYGSGYGQGYSGAAGYTAGPQAEEKKSNIDEVMKDIERKAMQRELEELKAKIAAYENKQKGDV